MKVNIQFMTIFSQTEIIPTAYLGREQAYIKHLLLERYLDRLLHIVGMAAQLLGYDEIVYVDCFAGPWGDESEDLAATSIGISLAQLAKVQAELAALGRRVPFRAIYIEKDPAAFRRLEAYLSTHSPQNVKTLAIHGDFEDKIPAILHACGRDSFTFYFIDPLGWKVVKPSTLAPLLARARSEYLINFMYDFVNRTVSMEAWQAEMAALFDAPIDMAELPTEQQLRERYLAERYQRAIEARAGTTRHGAQSVYVAIKDPLKDRTKYHLMYVTRHPKGIIEFMELCEKALRTQDAVRAAAKLNKKQNDYGISDMFAVDPAQIPSTQASDTPALEQYWLDRIGADNLQVDLAVFAKAICDNNALPTQLQTAVKNLIDAGKIRNLDADISRRRKKFVDYEKSERLQRVRQE